MRLFLFCFWLLVSLCGQNGTCAETSSHQKTFDFNDVLLVVHYNHPYYGSIEFIKKLYKNFPNVVFYGEKPHQNDPGAVIQVATQTGFFFTRVMSDVLVRFPSYRGYIFLQDDVLMNFWNFDRLDKDKIWFSVMSRAGNGPMPPTWDSTFDKKRISSVLTHARNSPYWWNSPYGKKPFQEASMLFTCNDWDSLQNNVGSREGIKAVCDMFYLPQKFRHNAVRLSKIFKKG